MAALRGESSLSPLSHGKDLYPGQEAGILGNSSKKRKTDVSAGSISILNSRDSASSDSDGMFPLFEPFSEENLIDLINHAALSDPSVYAQITRTADNDVSLRQLFFYGLAWDTTQDSLRSAFRSFGEIEICSLLSDKNTGNCIVV